jgi:hypothetical protein
MNLHEKYLKYKSKYLKLKQQIEKNILFGGESNEDLINNVASKLHEKWQIEFKANNPGITTRMKLSNGSDGEQIDILNTDYKDLPEFWKRENKLAAIVAVELFYEKLEPILSNYKSLPENLNNELAFVRDYCASIIHDKWLERNTWAKSDSNLSVEFNKLSENEKNKDRVQIDIVYALWKNQQEQK